MNPGRDGSRRSLPGAWPHDETGGTDVPFSPATQVGAREPVEIRWRWPRGLYGLSIANFLLNLVTLGLYAPWARTEVRRRLWQAVAVNGQPLEYTGEGRQLFLGLLIVGAILVVLTGIYYAVGLYLLLPGDRAISEDDIDRANTILSLLLLPVMAFLWGVAKHRAMRFRLRHTLWRGIRGTMDGSALRYGWMYLWTHVPVILSLGLLVPWRTIRLRNALFSDMRFGGGPFRCEARWQRLMPVWLVFWGSAAVLVLYGLLMLYLFVVMNDPYVASATLMSLAGRKGSLPGWVPWAVAAIGLYAFLLYEAKKLNEIAASTRFQNVRFSMDMTVNSIIGLLLRNYLLLFVSFGILKPVMLANIAGHLVEHLKAEGLLDVASLTQLSEEAEEKTGEGLASYLDIDGI